MRSLFGLASAPVIVAGFTGAALLLLITSRWQPYGLRADISALEARVDQLEWQSKDTFVARLHDAAILKRLRWHIDSPRFARHRDRCAQCRGETFNEEEGGPAPLCDEGFRALGEDAKQ
jgi:hypothetical protein